ncbi:hypothetical protein N752_31005 [Desulforamulus aquiferis]|nr:hypothetical protein N752_31005 [Desulforamulus aquiferis]
MECYERGIIKAEELEGLELNFSNGQSLVKILEMIGERRGIGNLLAEGSKRAAESWVLQN